MASLKDKFIEGCIANGVDVAVAVQLGRQRALSDYCFNKSHAACYALIAYHTAWAQGEPSGRVHGGADLFGHVDQGPRALLRLAVRRHGHRGAAADVNSSLSDFAVVEGRIRFGLSAVKTWGRARSPIIAAREDGPFGSIWDFCERVDGGVLNRRMLESLVACGALDSTGDSRQGMFEVLEAGARRRARSSRPTR